MKIFSGTASAAYSPGGTGPVPGPEPEPFMPWLKTVLVVLTLARLFLVSSDLLSFFPSGADDVLFVEHARTIIAGHWLGPYNQFTLAKGPFYSIYIALAFFAGIPLLLSQHLLYIAASATFVASIRRLVRNPLYLAVIYLVLLFNPMSFSGPYMTRVLREGIYHSLTIFTVSCALGLLLEHDRSIRRLALWSTGLGLSLAFFWLTREEGIWLLPSVVVILVFAAARVWRQGPVDRTGRLSLFVLPFVIWFFLLATVASVNKAHYGVFGITDFKSRSFISALHGLMRVKPERWRPMVPVPAEVRERIYEVSPAFAELRPFLDGRRPRPQRSFSCRNLGICDDIGGGWFMWALRASVSEAGYYGSARDADGYYTRLAEEIDAACAANRLPCLPAKTSVSILPPLNSYYTGKFLGAFGRGLVYLATFDGFRLRMRMWRRGWRPETRMVFEDVTGEQTAPLPGERSLIVLSGWPRYRIWPSSGFSSPMMCFNVTLLPVPERPIMVVTSPS